MKTCMVALFLACVTSLSSSTLKAGDIFISFANNVERSAKLDATKQAVIRELRKQLVSKGYTVHEEYPGSGCQCMGFGFRTKGTGSIEFISCVDATATYSNGKIKTLRTIPVAGEINPMHIPYKYLVEPEWMARKLIYELGLSVSSNSMSNSSVPPLASAKSSMSIKSKGRLTDEEREAIFHRLRSGAKLNRNTQTNASWNR